MFLKKVNEFCQKINIELMLENFLYPFDSPEQFQKVIKEIPNLKIHLDIGHINLAHEDCVEVTKIFFNKFGDKISHLHIHDKVS